VDITIRDISKLAGVSTATVSRVLADSEKVKPDTRNKVLKIIKEYGYEPNQIARNLTSSRTNTIGLVVETTSNPFFMEIAQAVEEKLTEAGYLMLTMNTNWETSREEASIRALRRNRVDGVILTPISLESESVRLLEKWSLPFVLLNIDAQREDISSIGTNDYQGGILAGQSLLKSGATSIVCLQGFPHQSTFNRLKGLSHTVRSSAEGKCRDIKIIENIRTYEEGYEIGEKLINYHLPPDGPLGVFATNDDVALGVLASLYDHGVGVPFQVSVVGYDDIPMSDRFKIPLTTIAQPTQELGKLAARSIMDQISGVNSSPRSYQLIPKIVQRASTVSF
jgi:DNA-binding LacI/PurR family transcriptional regulator